MNLDFLGSILHKLQILILALISWYLDDWIKTRQGNGISIIIMDGKQSYEVENFQMFTCIQTYKCIHKVALHEEGIKHVHPERIFSQNFFAF